MYTCFLIGNRDTPDSVLETLISEVERHVVQYHVTEFVAGNYGNFDRLARTAVKHVKQNYPMIKFTLLLAYYPMKNIPDGIDETLYPPKIEQIPKRAAIVRANQYMVEHSDYLITYVKHEMGNTWGLLEYARKRKNIIEIKNLAR